MNSVGSRGRPLIIVGIVLLAGCTGAVPSDPSASAPETGTESTPTANGTIEIHYIDVGQSVNTLIVGPDGDTMLVDTGHYNDDGDYVLEYLQAHDITSIDHLVTSHNDADHIGGNAAIMSTTRRKPTASAPSMIPGSQRAHKPTPSTSTPSRPTT
jgi:competence protein ComEC